MLVENQMVEVKWSATNRIYYERKGYAYTKNRDSFLIKAEDAHHNSRKTKIKVCCDYCGIEKTIATQDYYKNTKDGTIKYSCGSKGCASKKHAEFDEQRKEQQFKKFVDLCTEFGYTPISTINDYASSLHSKLKYKCSFHGIQEITLNNLQHGNGCKLCAVEQRAYNRRLSNGVVKERIESINHNIWLNPHKYTNNRTSNLEILCGICGKRKFITNLDCYMKGNKDKCDYCARSQSNNERIIQYFLEKYNINFVHNFRFKDCRDKRSLPFDFYLKEYNLCIEFDGEHHFHAIYGKERFLSTVNHDSIKSKYCNENNIKLIRIPYWDRDNIEQILVTELNLTPITSI